MIVEATLQKSEYGLLYGPRGGGWGEGDKEKGKCSKEAFEVQ